MRRYSAKFSLKTFFKQNRTMIYFVGIMLAILIAIIIMQSLLAVWIKDTPALKSIYDTIRAELDKNSLLWLFIISAIGGTLFIAIPMDTVFLFYIIGGSNWLLALPICYVGIMVGRVFDYYFGYLFSDFVTRKIIKDDAKKYSDKWKKGGNAVLFWGNFIPFFPVEFFITFLGTLKYDFRKVMIYNGAAKLIQLVLILIVVKGILIYTIKVFELDLWGLFKSLIELGLQ